MSLGIWMRVFEYFDSRSQLTHFQTRHNVSNVQKTIFQIVEKILFSLLLVGIIIRKYSHFEYLLIQSKFCICVISVAIAVRQNVRRS